MTTAFALQYIPQRMREIGICEYRLQWRHLVLGPTEIRTISAGNDLYFIISELPNIRLDPIEVLVESEFGIWDMRDGLATNELQVEHRGEITLTNVDEAKEDSHIQFIQVIPLNPKNENHGS